MSRRNRNRQINDDSQADEVLDEDDGQEGVETPAEPAAEEPQAEATPEPEPTPPVEATPESEPTPEPVVEAAPVEQEWQPRPLGESSGFGSHESVTAPPRPESGGFGGKEHRVNYR